MNTINESHLERRFKSIWESVAPELTLVEQKKGVVAGRRFVYDFLVLDAGVLVECNGGTWARGNSGHSSGSGIARDAEKVNQAQIFGYNIFVLTVDKLTKDYVENIANFCRDKINDTTSH